MPVVAQFRQPPAKSSVEELDIPY